MANQLDAYIPELWANESVMLLWENMVMANLVHTDFSPKAARFGDIVNTRKPNKFSALRKTAADNVTIQDASAENIQVPLNQHIHTSFKIEDENSSKSFKELRDEFLEPAIMSIASEVDRILLGQAHEFYVNNEGFAGGVDSSNVKDYIINTRKRMNINLAPEGSRFRNLILTPNTEAEALKLDTFHEADKVGDAGTALREASLGTKFGFNMFMCQNAPSITGVETNAAAPLVDNVGGYLAGATVIHIDTAGSALEVGQWIKIAGDEVPHLITALGTLTVDDIDVTISPPLRAAVADDAAVTVGGQGAINLAAGYAAGYAKELVVDGFTGLIPIGTPIKLATAGTPNVLLTGEYSVTAQTDTAGNTTGITLNKPLLTPVVDDDVVFLGLSGEYNFAFHRNAIAMVSRPLAAAPRGLALSSVASANGVGVRVTITYNGDGQHVLVTVDLLMGLETLDTDLGAVLVG